MEYKNTLRQSKGGVQSKRRRHHHCSGSDRRHCHDRFQEPLPQEGAAER